MSVLIEGMELPTNADMAPTAVWVYPNGYAVVFKDNGKEKQYTQAVSVPPHVDLIDRNKLIQSVSEETCDCNPDHFDLDDKDGYGEWMLHNGINTGIVAASVRIKAAHAIIPEDEVV